MEDKNKITEDHIINFVKKKHEEKERLKHIWKASLQEKDKTVVALPKPPKAKVRRIPLYAKYAMAASLALLLSIGIYWSTSTNSAFENPTALALAYENNFPKPHLDQLKGGTQDILTAIKKEYATNNFPKTLQLIKELPPEALTDKLTEISGYCHFKTGQYKAAIQDLEKVVNNGNQSLDNAFWFLALAHLKQTPPALEKAMTYLEQLKPYKTKAKEAESLIEGIEQLREGNK